MAEYQSRAQFSVRDILFLPEVEKVKNGIALKDGKRLFLEGRYLLRKVDWGATSDPIEVCVQEISPSGEYFKAHSWFTAMEWVLVETLS